MQATTWFDVLPVSGPAGVLTLDAFLPSVSSAGGVLTELMAMIEQFFLKDA